MYKSTFDSDSHLKSDSSSQRTPPRPLGKLRVSSLQADTSFSSTQKPQIRGTVKRKTKYSNKLRLKKETDDSGFSLDATLPLDEDPEVNGPPEVNSAATDSAVQLASIFMASAKTANAKFNVVSSLNNNQPKYLSGEEGELIEISKAARLRAESAKTFFELKYKWLDKSIGLDEDQSDDDDDSEATYNPLQTIRNRRLRKKLRIPNYTAGDRHMTLACNAFSSHSGPNGQQWKMLWGIDTNEILTDIAWRKYFNNELKGSIGDSWPHDSTSLDTSSQSDGVSKRLHDKLWGGDDGERSDTENYLNEIPVVRVRSRDGMAKTITQNLKHKAKKLYSTSAVFPSDPDFENPTTSTPQKSSDSLLQLKINHATRDVAPEDETLDPRSVRNDPDASGGSLGSSKAKDSMVNLPDAVPRLQVSVSDEIGESPKQGSISKSGNADDNAKTDDATAAVSSIHFNSIMSRAQEQAAETGASEGNTKSQAGTLSKEALAELQKTPSVVKDSVYTKSLVSVSSNYWSEVLPLIAESTNSRLNHMLNDTFNDLFQAIYNINNNSIPPQEDFFKAFVEEVKSLNHLANEECATKIDNLLSSTDRSYGELNTSLLMELRKTSEQIDRISRSLFGSGLSSISTEDEPIQLASFGERRLMYLVLENFIVIVLRLIWIFVTVFKAVFKVFGWFWQLATFIRHLFF